MRREGEGWTFYRGDTPGRPGGADRPPAAPVGRAQRRSPVGWATGPCRPPNGQQDLFFSRDLIANLKKKITLKACRPMGGDRGVFLKYLKTDIYF